MGLCLYILEKIEKKQSNYFNKCPFSFGFTFLAFMDYESSKFKFLNWRCSAIISMDFLAAYSFLASLIHFGDLFQILLASPKKLVLASFFSSTRKLVEIHNNQSCLCWELNLIGWIRLYRHH